MSARRTRIAALLTACIEAPNRPKVVNWNELKAVVIDSELGREKINWLEVRGVLQGMIKKGTLTRTDDLSVDEYTING